MITFDLRKKTKQMNKLSSMESSIIIEIQNSSNEVFIICDIFGSFNKT